mmetsp:Transcript_18162/g.51221  ORF Transcript_18162/g.51221 Transcript_18162/m.51221 type:complete len:352 (-) Transcript_18162:357-1412(-)
MVKQLENDRVRFLKGVVVLDIKQERIEDGVFSLAHQSENLEHQLGNVDAGRRHGIQSSTAILLLFAIAAKEFCMVLCKVEEIVEAADAHATKVRARVGPLETHDFPLLAYAVFKLHVGENGGPQEEEMFLVLGVILVVLCLALLLVGPQLVALELPQLGQDVLAPHDNQLLDGVVTPQILQDLKDTEAGDLPVRLVEERVENPQRKYANIHVLRLKCLQEATIRLLALAEGLGRQGALHLIEHLRSPLANDLRQSLERRLADRQIGVVHQRYEQHHVLHPRCAARLLARAEGELDAVKGKGQRRPRRVTTQLVYLLQSLALDERVYKGLVAQVVLAEREDGFFLLCQRPRP